MASQSKYGKKVSIVVPVYNVEAFLEECLDSLIAQTYSNLEILLIDDGSTDRSGDICELYGEKDSRIRIFHKKNGGVSSARNFGIDMAEGDYLVFVDSDDCVHKDLVEMYMACIKAGETVLCDKTSDKQIWDNIIVEDCIYEEECLEKEKFMKLYFEDYINPPFNKCYDAAIIKYQAIRFPEKMNLGEDLIFNLDYFRCVKGGYRIIHFPLYFYREERNGSLSNRYYEDLFMLQQKMFIEIRKFLEDTFIWTEENQRLYYGIYWDRLYMTAQMYGKRNELQCKNGGEHDMKGFVSAPVWKEVWNECKKRKLLNWKRRLKFLYLKILWR